MKKVNIFFKEGFSGKTQNPGEYRSSLTNICFVSLGCDKNRVDSEVMRGLLENRGYRLVEDHHKADIVVINTCGFIDDAKEESISNILDAADLKKEGSISLLVACGCLVQRYGESLKEEIPEIDCFVGTGKITDIAEAIEQAEKEGDVFAVESPEQDLIDDLPRNLTTPGYTAYLKIAEGCDHHCSYCVIPQVRGPYRSQPPNRLVREAEHLAEKGVKELNLVAQDLTLYGRDLNSPLTLTDLLTRLVDIQGLEWIRLLYCYPENITDQLLELMAEKDTIVNYLDLPLQHASDRILRLMNRKSTRRQLEQLIKHIRRIIPEIALRTTFMVGFPGETAEDFRILADFARRMEFDRLGVFCYSREEDTPAYNMEKQVPETMKKERRKELMELAREISSRKNQTLIGTNLKVLLEEKISEAESEGNKENLFIGRTYRDAPEVDGAVYVHLKPRHKAAPGDFVETQITDAYEYDLIGEESDESTQ